MLQDKVFCGFLSRPKSTWGVDRCPS